MPRGAGQPGLLLLLLQWLLQWQWRLHWLEQQRMWRCCDGRAWHFAQHCPHHCLLRCPLRCGRLMHWKGRLQRWRMLQRSTRPPHAIHGTLQQLLQLRE